VTPLHRTNTYEGYDRGLASSTYVIKEGGDPTSLGWDAGNIIMALKNSGRVSEISLPRLTSTLLGRVAVVVQAPYLALTSLELSLTDETAAVLPDLFLGGSAPRLQKLDLYNVPFPALTKLLSSATHLVYLRILDVPNFAYISPEAMATCLSAMTGLKTFHLAFRSPRPPPDQAGRHPPPLTRTILPALNCFFFRGNSEYLDDLVARIDTPLLDNVTVTLFNQLVFDTPQFMQFIGRIGQLNAHNQADLLFHGDYIKVKFSSRRGRVNRKTLVLVVKCRDSDWQLLALAQVFSIPSPPLCTLERLGIFDCHDPPPRWQDDTEDAQ